MVDSKSMAAFSSGIKGNHVPYVLTHRDSDLYNFGFL